VQGCADEAVSDGSIAEMYVTFLDAQKIVAFFVAFFE